MRKKARVDRFLRVESSRGRQYVARLVGADACREPPRAENDPEAQARHAEGGVGRSHPYAAARDEVRACAENAAVSKREGFVRCVMERLQQHLDPDEAQREIAFARTLVMGEIETCAEVRAFAVENQQAGAV